jgi:hypothetical protein
MTLARPNDCHGTDPATGKAIIERRCPSCGATEPRLA